MYDIAMKNAPSITNLINKGLNRKLKRKIAAAINLIAREYTSSLV